MVEVPVHDGDPVKAAERLCDGDGGVVEYAKAHLPVGLGVVARRADKRKTVLSVEGPLDRRMGGACGRKGDLERRVRYIGVIVEKQLPVAIFWIQRT